MTERAAAPNSAGGEWQKVTNGDVVGLGKGYGVGI